ncbi:nuclear transport factor 2 family protein [Actinomadura barringtoniae]|uniref:Nuclear transport factor 2 family protein n=1 Tax=Actinomadura barringtoniae TaxID=1427535 RepID=A0A939PFZ1_9ACTN|nr:nuclear transport factor 2 family protein [Actinomadura barringtoniae]MBO2451573.1 nuclear transport factor 2 family protein [Actinomadura barringtoniae]
MSDNVSVVQELYEAFGKGDVTGVLDRLSPAIRWNDAQGNMAQRAGVPWMQSRHGIAEVAEFFKVVGELEFHRFDVVTMVASGDHVVARVLLDYTAPSGARIQDDSLHFWTFDELGAPIAFQEYLDTAKAITAYRPT